MSENVLETQLKNQQKPFLIELENKYTLLAKPNEDGGWDVRQHNFTGEPLSRRCNITFNTLKSFLEYLNKYKTEASNIYLNVQGQDICVSAILNDCTPDKLNFSNMKLEYAPNKTLSAEGWLENSERQMTQDQFVRFLEQNSKDITNSDPNGSGYQYPSSSEVLQFCSEMEYIETSTFKRSYREQDGRVSFSFENKGGNEKKILAFQKFAIALTPFVGGGSFFVEAALKFRVNKNDGHLLLWYELQNLNAVIESAVQEIEQTIHSQAADVPVYHAQVPSNSFD